YLIDQHPAGWSTICGRDFSLQPGWIDTNERACMKCGKKNWEHYEQYYKSKGIPLPKGFVHAEHTPQPEEKPEAPECYCHGGRQEDMSCVSEKNAAAIGWGWAYVFAQDKT